MFCYQCEQTAGCSGCTKHGVCGKDPKTAAMQDMLLYAAKGISMYAHRARLAGKVNQKVDRFVIEALFTTVTNVNFDAEKIYKMINKAVEAREMAKKLYEEAGLNSTEELHGPALFDFSGTIDELQEKAKTIGVAERKSQKGDTFAGLQELLMYGLKGTAAYADHAYILGKEDGEVYAYFHEALNFLTNDDVGADEILGMILRCGEVNLKVMGLLDSANTSTYGDPTPTKVRITQKKGKAILVSGHELKDLEELLKQTQGKNINVYTHGEMLPCHGYPGLKKYGHLVGNYGGAWQDQQKEFNEFPGAILMTTNCIQKPKDDYKKRIFTSGLVEWPGVEHIRNRDFSPVIEEAQKSKGFDNDGEEKYITVGFGHNAVLSVAPQIIDAVKAGKIKHFFLIGGCDGAKSGRNYYTEFAEKVPQDSVILTLACGKYRFNKKDFGDIGGIPRLLDIGQCNDAYSAIQIAVALSKAFDCGVNDLPLSLILSWYEQKAVCILLTLLHLGIKNIRLGPTLPAFITKDILDILVEKFNIMPISTPDEDLKAILG
ncbi:hydroxylamine reductase [bacterium]|nr:hydroxylamine reductase [bacterium]